MNVLLSLSYRLLIVAWITAKRQQLHNRTAQRTSWNKTYDFIVVGAGTAGCAVAHRLAETRQYTVLLLEAGGAQDAIFHDIPQNRLLYSTQPQLLWNYYNEPTKNTGKQFPLGRVAESRGKVIGGSSNPSSLMYVRGNRKGFDEWETKYGAIGWNYRDILPFFIKFENNTDLKIVEANPGYHGTSGPVQISTPQNANPRMYKMIKVLNSLGIPTIDLNGPNQNGTMISQSFVGLNGLRSSSGTAYVDPNPYPDNLHIVTDALVYRIIFDGLNAIGVEFNRNDSPFKVFATKEIILSAGSINTPQLLMLSGVGPRAHLQSLKIPLVMDLPVGDNYKCNANIRIGEGIPTPMTLNNLEELYYNKSGVMSSFPLLIPYFSTKNNLDKSWPNIKLNIQVHPYNRLIGYSMEIHKTRSKGTIRLQSVSPYIPPLISPNFLYDPRDFEDAIDALKFLFYLTQLPQVLPMTPNFTIEYFGCQPCPGVNDYLCESGLACVIRNQTNTSWQGGGSCRMGALNRTDVVVGPQLFVKNMKRLRVCDASIFPDEPNSGTTAAATMVGEKCAHLIKTYN